MPSANQLMASEVMRERERLYKLIIGQLRSDKFETVAYELTVALKNATGGLVVIVLELYKYNNVYLLNFILYCT